MLIKYGSIDFWYSPILHIVPSSLSCQISSLKSNLKYKKLNTLPTMTCIGNPIKPIKNG
jgi:hypothetical protein